MIGGYQILDLRGIDLTKGSVASNITNAYVLKQLLQLRDHIDKAYDFSKPLTNQLKPVLIRFRDKKSGEKTEGATFGELSVNGNYYTFKITARISGALVLTINVAFEEITNDYGNKEWVIDTATILLKDESKTITGDLELSGDLSVGDDATITGDASVGGDLSVVGDIDGANIDMSGKIEGAEIVEKMTGYACTLLSSTNYTKEAVYFGVCKNGNKLTIVCAMKLTRTADVEGIQYVSFGNFNIPEAVGSKLYPVTYGGSSFLSTKKLLAFGNNFIDPVEINGYIQKVSNNSIAVNLAFGANALTKDQEYYVRYEETFLLNDSLVTE